MCHFHRHLFFGFILDIFSINFYIIFSFFLHLFLKKKIYVINAILLQRLLWLLFVCDKVPRKISGKSETRAHPGACVWVNTMVTANASTSRRLIGCCVCLHIPDSSFCVLSSRNTYLEKYMTTFSYAIKLPLIFQIHTGEKIHPAWYKTVKFRSVSDLKTYLDTWVTNVWMFMLLIKYKHNWHLF